MHDQGPVSSDFIATYLVYDNSQNLWVVERSTKRKTEDGKQLGKGFLFKKDIFFPNEESPFFRSMVNYIDPHFTISLSLSQHFLCPFLCILATKTKVDELEKK